MKPTKDNWLELRVGDANDKAKDYFTQGDIKFIKYLLSRQKQELKEKLKKMKLKHPDYERHTHVYIFEGRGKCNICKMSWNDSTKQGIYNQVLSDVLAILEKEEG